MPAIIDAPMHSRRRFLQLSGAALLASQLPGCGSDTDYSIGFDPAISWGRERIAEQMRLNPNVAAISIALLHGNAVVWREAFGMAAVQDARPATVDTRFSLASVSKVLAGLSAVILRDMELLDLDRPVTQYLAGFSMLSPDYTKITTRQLLSHTSGLPGSNERNSFSLLPLPGFAEDTEAGFAHSHLKHAPGQMAVYCNDGFTLFERVVLAVSGLTYPKFVHQHILEPLGMNQSGFLTEPISGGDFCLPYSDGRQYGLVCAQPYACGGLYSTPSDMMKLARMFIGAGEFKGQRIVSQAGIAEMAAEQTLGASVNPSPEARWGLGWDSVRHPSMETAGILGWQKNGDTDFFHTEFFVLPDSQMALLVTGNIGYDPLSIAEGVLLRSALTANVIHTLPPIINTSLSDQVAPPNNLGGFMGIYGNSTAPLKAEWLAGDVLSLRKWSQDGWQPIDGGSGRFTLRNDGWWWAENGSLPNYRFELVETVEGGMPVSFRYLMTRNLPGAGYRYITMPVGQLLSPREPLSLAWARRLGTSWRISNDHEESIDELLNNNKPMALNALPELPGYVLFGDAQLLTPLSDERAGMSVKIPGGAGRDLHEIAFPPAAGGKVLQIGTSLYARA